MTVIGIFAEFATKMDPPEQAVAAARLCLLDWYGAAIAGADAMPATGLRRALSGTGPAGLIPDGAPADPRTAALINGTASHIVEVDDIYRPGLYHPGVVAIPAALALAEAENADARTLLRAIIAGYEVGNRIAAAVNPGHYAHWHTTGTVGHFGAAAAGAVALELGAEQTAHALATVATMAAGLRHAFSSDGMSKPLHAGRAAEAGVLAALTAREGVTGVGDMLEGARGFGVAMADGPDWDGAVADLGDVWTVTRITPKAHACCGHNFAPLDAVRHLGNAHGVDPRQIETIEVDTYRAALDICGNPDPVSAPEARFSLPWCAAWMATHGDVTPAAFTAGALADSAIRALASRVVLRADPGAEARFPGARSATVTLVMQDGTRLSHHRPTRKGDPDDPLSSDEIVDKFLALSEPVIGSTAAQSFAQCILEMDNDFTITCLRTHLKAD